MFTSDLFPILNSLTKYPSIPTYHALGERGRLTETTLPIPAQPLFATEKIDGTNARIIIHADDWLIGSRENLLCAKGDRIGDPSQGIVETLRSLPDGICDYTYLTVLYGEVYGGRTTACKSYGASVGFVVFDIMQMPLEEFERWKSKPLSTIAEWRDSGGQPFLPRDRMLESAERLGLRTAPTRPVPPMPASIEAMHAWLGTSVMTTAAAMGIPEPGPAEGVVVRSADRKFICKIRAEDYARAMRGMTKTTPVSAV